MNFAPTSIFFMKIKTLLLLVFLIIPWLTQAQRGQIMLTHVRENNQFQNWSVAQDSLNNMYFANRKGILQYNGERWNFIDTRAMPYALYTHPSSGKVYVGAEQDIGYLKTNETGRHIYKSLTPKTSIPGKFINIEPVDSVIYFMSQQVIIRIDPSQPGQKKFWRAEANQPFTGMVHNNQHVFINQWNEGLHRLQSDTLFPIVSGYKLKNQEILFSLPYDSTRVLIGTDANRLYLFDGMKISPYRVANHSYLAQGIISGAENISQRYLALSTLAGGAVIIDKKAREIRYTINYQTGLPDDEVAALELDRQGGLWICHASGITRAHWDLPAKNFSHYPGFEGRPLHALKHQGTLYLATSEGLYHLGKEKKYREKEVTVRVEKEVPDQSRSKKQAASASQQKNKESQKAKQKESGNVFKRFFNKIFNKQSDSPKEKAQEGTDRNKFSAQGRNKAQASDKDKDNEEGQAEEKAQAGQKGQPVTKAQAKEKGQTGKKAQAGEKGQGDQASGETRVSYRKKKIYSLQSVDHRFKKIDPVEGKCEILRAFREGVLAGSHNGLYHIGNHNGVKTVIQGIHPHQVVILPQEASVLIASESGVYRAELRGDTWHSAPYLSQISEPVYSMALQPEEGHLWLGCNDKAYRARIKAPDDPLKSYSIPTPYPERYLVRRNDQNIHLFTSSGVSRFDAAADTFIRTRRYAPDASMPDEFRCLFTPGGHTFIKQSSEWQIMGNSTPAGDTLLAYLQLFDQVQDLNITPDLQSWIIAGNELYRVDLRQGLPRDEGFRAYFTRIRVNNQRHFLKTHLKVSRENVPLAFRLAAPQYMRNQQIQYQYRIEGLMEDWSQWSEDPEIQVFTQKGHYTVQARARNLWGQVSSTRKIRYEVPPPFTETSLFYVILLLAAGGLFFLAIKLRERKLQRDKRILEEAVKQRTATIEEQKNEITTQRDAILQQKNTIEQKNQEITGSIEYAQRIQSALLPKEEQFKQAFSDHLIIFKPRSIVSGDFYWIHTNQNKVYVTAADCTGHGVPGAFMSMLGISSLNEILSHHRTTPSNAAEILNQLRSTVKNSLHQTGKTTTTKDGMDMSLCVIDRSQGKLDFAGAFNPLFIFRNGSFEKFSGDRMPVGIYHSEKNSFTNHRLEIHPGDTLYLFSDGYIDQLGGPRHKKFKSKNLMALLQKIYTQPMAEQKAILEQQFEEWKNGNFQVDDVVLLGLRL